jgi:hypothetical protein
MNIKDISQIAKDFVKKYKFSVKVGWFEEKAHRYPKRPRELGSYGGGETRKTGKMGKINNQEVLKFLIDGGRDVLNSPFKRKVKEREKLVHYIMNPINRTSSSIKRIINLSKSFIMVPMMKGQYKAEKPATVKQKGFSRPSIDTGQLVKGVNARYEKNRV